MTEFIFKYTFLIIFNIILFILSATLLTIRINKWGVSMPFINLIAALRRNKKINFYDKIKALINVLIYDFMNLSRAGGACEERLHYYGRFFVLYGFGGAVILGIVSIIVNPEGIALGFFNPLTILSYIAYFMLGIGSVLLIFRRLYRINLRKTTDLTIWLLQALLLYFSLSAIIFISLYNAGMLMFSVFFYYLYLSALAAIYIYFPLSEIGYFAWKASALLSHALVEGKVIEQR